MAKMRTPEQIAARKIYNQRREVKAKNNARMKAKWAASGEEYKKVHYAHTKKYDQSHREEIREYHRLRQLAFGEELNKGRRDRRSTDEDYRLAHMRRALAWAKRNPDLMIEYNHRRRANKQENGSDDCSEIVIKLRKEKNCYWCRRPFTKTVHIEHVVPITRGGSHTPKNLVASCHSCNGSKWQYLPEEWIDRLEKDDNALSLIRLFFIKRWLRIQSLSK